MQFRGGLIDFHDSFSIPEWKDSLLWTWQNCWALATQKVTDQSLASMSERDKVRWIAVLNENSRRRKITSNEEIDVHHVSAICNVLRKRNCDLLLCDTWCLHFHVNSLEDWQWCREGCANTSGCDSSRSQDICTSNWKNKCFWFYLIQLFI